MGKQVINTLWRTRLTSSAREAAKESGLKIETVVSMVFRSLSLSLKSLKACA
jgi:hypothetical protein